MSPIRRIWNVVRRRQLDDELRQEVETHLALLEEEARANGASDGGARRHARTRFGSGLAHREQALDGVMATTLENTWKEIGFAARRLLRSPAFTVAAVLTLALAIGANAAIFAVVERVLLNPLPYPESDRLIDVTHTATRLSLGPTMGITRGYYFLYRERAHTLEGITLYDTIGATLTGDGDPQRIRVTRATTSFASVMRVWPAVGRWFTEEEDRPGAPPRVVLSYGLWMRRYGGDRGVIGKPISLSGVSTEIVGVMPQSFAFPDATVDAWTMGQITREMGFGIWLYNAVGRLRDGVSVDDARRELNALVPDVVRAFPGDPFAQANSSFLGVVSVPRTIKEAMVGDVSRALWIVLAAVGLVLLVACANVANLFLVRSEARQRELAVRLAIGAGRAGITRYFLAESVLLSIAGAIVGLAVAWSAVGLLVAAGPATLPRIGEIRLDGVTVAYTFALSLVTALVFGAIPLWRSIVIPPKLNEGGRGNTGSRRRHRARHLLMGGQVALALILLIGSGLVARSFQKIRDINPGFNPESAITFNIALPAGTYPTRASAVAAHQAILERVSTLPGVTVASSSTCLPLSPCNYGNTVQVQGRPFVPGTPNPNALFRAVGVGYFETMGIPLKRGRSITRDDIERKAPVIVVDEAFAKRVFPGEDPIGQYVVSSAPPPTPGGPPGPVPLQIVGVVGNTPIRSLAEPVPASQLYMPMSIAGGPDIPPQALVGPDVSLMRFVVRSTTPPTTLLKSIRRAVDGVDPKLAIAQVATLQEMVDRASAQMAFTMTLIAAAAAVALLLGIIGIYGVMSYIVSQRTSEIGVRLALGAEPLSVAAMILRQGGVVALAGSVIGLLAALAGSRLLTSLLYGISPQDPVVFAGTTLLLLLVAALACWLPARRAARLSPLEALRAD
jgi:putative ABC transport system permease protein